MSALDPSLCLTTSVTEDSRSTFDAGNEYSKAGKFKSNSCGDLAPTRSAVIPGLDRTQANDILAGCSPISSANEMSSEIASKVSASMPSSP